MKKSTGESELATMLVYVSLSTAMFISSVYVGIRIVRSLLEFWNFQYIIAYYCMPYYNYIFQQLQYFRDCLYFYV